MTAQVLLPPRPLKPRPVGLLISVLGFLGWVGFLVWIYFTIHSR